MSKPKLTRRQQHWYREVITCLKSSPTRDFSYCYRPISTNDSWVWGAYYCAKEYGSRTGVDLKKLQLITLRYGNVKRLYKYAKNIPGANIKRFQKAIVEIGEYKYVKMFLDNVPGANRVYLNNILIIIEVMDF